MSSGVLSCWILQESLSYAPVLTAWKEFEPYEVVATTYQAISGAGKTFKDWMEQFGFTATKPLVVPSLFFWKSMTFICSGLISGTTIGTSGVQRCAELLDTTGVSVFAYASSIALISSFDI